MTRAQAATIVDRAVTTLRGSPLPSGPQRFDPQRTVTRGQAASLAIRA